MEALTAPRIQPTVQYSITHVATNGIMRIICTSCFCPFFVFAKKIQNSFNLHLIDYIFYLCLIVKSFLCVCVCVLGGGDFGLAVTYSSSEYIIYQ